MEGCILSAGGGAVFYQVFPIIIKKGTNCLWLKTISHTKGFDGAIQVS